jgi:hypothetical protein
MQLMSMPAITSASKLGAIAQVIKSTVYTPFYRLQHYLSNTTSGTPALPLGIALFFLYCAA